MAFDLVKGQLMPTHVFFIALAIVLRAEDAIYHETVLVWQYLAGLFSLQPTSGIPSPRCPNAWVDSRRLFLLKVLQMSHSYAHLS